MTSLDRNLSRIKLVGLDVDGVLTDGGLILQDDGQESKRFHSRDGLGLKFLMRAGLTVALITGRESRVVAHRARDLGLTEVHQGVANKWRVFAALLERLKLTAAEAAFAGDDIVDLAVMTRCGLALAPANAVPEVLARAHFVSPSPGGHGAVRQMAEFILKAQGRWDDLLNSYLNQT